MGATDQSVSKGQYFTRMLLKSLRVRKRRVAIAFFSLTIGAMIITAFASIYFDISIKMSQELRTYGANFFVGSDESTDKRTIDSSVYQDVLKAIPSDKLVGGSPYLYGIVRIDLGKVVMAGVQFSGLKKLSPFWQVDGNWINVDFDEANCMVGYSLARRMELKVGDIFDMTNAETGFQHRLKIKGIMETGQAEDEQILVNYSLASKVLGMKNIINHAMFSIVTNQFDIQGLADTIESQHPGVTAKVIRKVSYSEGKILGKIKGLMALVAIIILATTTLCVMTTLMAMVVERNHEIGLMKALGAEDRDIVRQFLVETGIIAIAGVIAGLIVGFLLAQVLGQAVFSSYISFRIVVLPLTIVISLIAALIAAAVPVNMAVKIVPAQVLRGE